MNTHRTLTEAVRVRVTPEILEALQRQAEREDRPVGAVIRRFIRDGLERSDLLKEGKETP